MPAILLGSLLLPAPATAQTKGSYDLFDYAVPHGWTVERAEQYLALKKDDGVRYGNVFLFRPRPSAGDPRADFEADWQSHARKHGLSKPADVATETENGWVATTGGGVAKHEGQPFYVSITTVTGRGLAFAMVTYFNDEDLAPELTAVAGSVRVNESRLAARATGGGPARPAAPPPAAETAPPPGGGVMTKYSTTFDDGWAGTVRPDYVEVARAGLEVRLHYPDDALEKARPDTVDVPEWYWSRMVTPAFGVEAPRKWAGVQHPVIYFMEGSAVDRRTGKPCWAAMKVVHQGGARVVVAVAPSEAAYRQAFGHPNDLDRMLFYNRFAVTPKDVVGTWARAGGGGVEYYNAYTGSHAGMAALSTTDEFTFRADGTYASTHRSASTTDGATRFDGLDYRGRYSVSDWAVTATNRVDGKPKKLHARLEAVRNGYLLVLTDSDYEPLQYVLFRRAGR